MHFKFSLIYFQECWLSDNDDKSHLHADDLLLLSPSIHGLEMLVETSESFASEYGVTFNAKKTECICFGKNACPLQRQVNVSGHWTTYKVER